MGLGTERTVSAPTLSDFSQAEGNLSPEREVFRTLSAPVTVQWELTPFCNERCVHCYNYWRGPKSNEKLVISPETLTTYDRASQEIVKNKVFQVTVTGGEPLSVLKQAYPYIERLTENGVGISFNTNLTILTKERARLLKNLGVRSILTSLISSDPELNDELTNRPNTHHDVSRGIRLALAEGFWVAVNMVVTKRNLFDIFSTAEYVKSLGVTAFSATKASTPINSPDFSEYALSREEFKFMINELLKVRRELGLHTDSLEFYPMCSFDTQEARDFAGNRICNAGKTACTIGFDGLVRPCSHASQTYGSITEDDGLRGSWQRLQPWRTDEYTPQQCYMCPSRNRCRGGCRTEAFAIEGRLNAPDPYCDFSHVVLPLAASDAVEVDLSAKYGFHPSIKSRAEEFGGILFVAPARWQTVTNILLKFYNEHRNSNFDLQTLAYALEVSLDNIRDTARILKQKMIIQERR